jgi:hypothetical protein
MDMHVPETRDQVFAAGIQNLRCFFELCALGRADCCDSPANDDNGLIGLRSAARGIYDGDMFENERDWRASKRLEGTKQD